MADETEAPSMFDALMVPVNPEYDFNKEPQENEFEYANPVTVNNQEILYANAAMQVTKLHVKANKKIAAAKLELKATREAREDIERKIVVQSPPGTNDSKNTRLMEAYIWRTAAATGKAEELQRLLQEERRLTARILDLEATAENLKLTQQTIKLAGEHGQTFLSYVKDEARRARFGT
jgi:hypothetical protein